MVRATTALIKKENKKSAAPTRIWKRDRFAGSICLMKRAWTIIQTKPKRPKVRTVNKSTIAQWRDGGLGEIEKGAEKSVGIVVLVEPP